MIEKVGGEKDYFLLVVRDVENCCVRGGWKAGKDMVLGRTELLV